MTDLETELSGLIFDVSKANGGEPFDTLSDALDYANNVLLDSQKKGGMSIKFVQSSDNKYVQYIYKLTDAATAAKFTNVANWYRIDLSNSVVPILNGLEMDWEQGGINSLGNETEMTTRIRTVAKVCGVIPLSLHCSLGYGYRVFEYDKDGVFIQYQNFDNGGLNIYTPSTSNINPRFRFCLIKTNGADIMPSDARIAQFTVSRKFAFYEDVVSNTVLDANIPYTEDGKFITLSSAVVGQVLTINTVQFSNYAYWLIDCNQGERFVLKTFVNTVAAKCYCVLDNNNKVLEIGINGKEEYSITIPKDGKKLIVNSRIETSDDYFVKGSVGRVTNVEVGLKKNQENISEIRIISQGISEIKDTICIVDFTTTRGFYYNGNHTTSQSENWEILSPIDVSKYIGQKYRIRVYSPPLSSDQLALSWFADSSDSEIETIYSDANKLIEGVIPIGAKWLYLSNRWATFSTPTLWINTVGEKVATQKWVEDRITGKIIRNNLVGKKVSFIGDSITEGFYASEAAKRYCNLFCSKYGAVVNNLGAASTCIANNTLNGLSSQRFVTRATSANLANSKLIVVFGGTNDFSYDCKAIGDLFAEETITPTDYIGDTQKNPVTDTDTFAGALHELITTIRTNCPNVPIVFITPLKRGRYNAGRPTSKEANQWGDYLDDFCTAIKEVCSYYAIPVLDASSVSELDFSNNMIASEFSQDNFHPNDNGHAVLAELLFRFVENNVVIL